MFFTHRTYCHKLSVYEKKLHNTSEMLLNLHLCSMQKLSYQSNICVCTGSLIGSQGYKPSPQTKPQSARQQNTYLFTGLLYFSTTDFDMQKIKIHSWILCIKGIFQVQYTARKIYRQYLWQAVDYHRKSFGLISQFENSQEKNWISLWGKAFWRA